jgi:hypothetical protein
MYGVPQCVVTIDSHNFEPASARVCFDRGAPIARAEIALDRDWEGRIAVGQKVAIAIGYRGKAPTTVFKGEITEIKPERLVHLTALDKCKKLRDTKVRLSLRNVTLQDVLASLLERAGIANYTLSTEPTPRRHHFLMANEGVLKGINQALSSWGKEWDCYADADEVIYILPWHESPRASVQPVRLEYGTNLTKLKPELAGTGTAETFLLPEVSHSHRVLISDAHLWGDEVLARVERVEHYVDANCARTRLRWTLI